MPAAGTCATFNAAKTRGAWPRCASDQSMRTGAEQPAVAGGGRGGDDDQLDDARRRRDAQLSEHEYERAYPRVKFRPGHQRHDHDQRAQIEDEDPGDDAVGRPRQTTAGFCASPAVTPISSTPS